MKKLNTHSRNSLFLMEMIFVLLFLSLSCTACIRIFALARENHINAQEWRHIQILTTTIGELMEGSDGTPDTYLSSLPGGTVNEETNGNSSVSSLSWYYDSGWRNCSGSHASYEMLLDFSSTKYLRQGTLRFFRLAQDSSEHNRTQIYTIDFSFPICITAQEAVS